MRTLAIILLALMGAAPASAGASEIAKGMPLTQALLELESRGLNLIFTTQLVQPDMRVKSPPTSTNLREIARELIAPHGLDIAVGPGGVLIVVRGKPTSPPMTAQPQPKPILRQQILVHPGPIPVIEQPASTNVVSESEVQTLPRQADDVFHTLSVLPGATATDLSAVLHVRGARPDELQIVLDGQELYEPYHLKDFDNAVSIVGASALGSVNLMTGALPVNYGDRGAGVLDMVTSAPAERLRVTASLLGVQLDAGDTYGGKSRWYSLVRRGTSAFLGRTFDVEAPSYSDLFAKFDHDLNVRHTLGIRTLLSMDEFNYDASIEVKQLDTEYLIGYVWLTHQGLFAGKYSVDTTASATEIKRDRRGIEQDPERSFNVTDGRDSKVAALTHSWNIQIRPDQVLTAGVDYRRFSTSYDYTSSRTFTNPLAVVRSGDFTLDDRFKTEHLGVYASDRIRPMPSLTLDLGVRYDRHTPLNDEIVSPRVSAIWAIDPSTVLRMAWGRYSQSQRAYELMLQDGDASFYHAERPEQWLIGAEQLFDGPIASTRVEIYRRTVSNPRPRYINLFDTFDAFPEGQFDRVRIEPSSSTATGAEAVLRGRRTGRVGWWLNYAYATTRDEVDGESIPREIDQTHTLNADVNVALGWHWNLNATWIYRTGWPTTSIDFVSGLPVLGELHDERLPDYHRLDLRLGREWQTRAGSFGVFFDARNVYNRHNVAGLDVQLNAESGELEIDAERWPGFFASAGVTWRFR